MLIKYYTFFIILFYFNCISCSSTNDVIGSELDQQPDVYCISIATSVYDHYMMHCTYGDYDVRMKDMPMKNFTRSQFCAPSPKFAYYFWDDVKDKNGDYNVTVCKLDKFWQSKTYVLPCQQEYLKSINCNNTYIKDEKEADNAEEITSYPTRITFALKESSTKGSSSTSIQSRAATITEEVRQKVPQEHHIWTFTSIELLALVCTCIGVGIAVAIAFVCLWCRGNKYKTKYRRLRKQQLLQPRQQDPPNSYIKNNVDEQE